MGWVAPAATSNSGGNLAAHPHGSGGGGDDDDDWGNAGWGLPPNNGNANNGTSAVGAWGASASNDAQHLQVSTENKFHQSSS